jgi:hypothetical protein
LNYLRDSLYRRFSDPFVDGVDLSERGLEGVDRITERGLDVEDDLVVRIDCGDRRSKFLFL